MARIASTEVVENVAQSLAISPDGLHALTTSSIEHVCYWWDLTTGDRSQILRGHEDQVLACALTSDGSFALSASRDGSARFWDLTTGTCLRALHGHEGSVQAVVALPDNYRAASGGYDRTLRLWDLRNGACRRIFEGHKGTVADVAALPDRNTLLSASWDGTLRLWDCATGQCLAVLSGHEGDVYAVAVSASGRHAVSAGRDRTVRLWDLPEQRCAATYVGHEGPIWRLTLAPDGARVAWASGDTVLMWEASTGICLPISRGRALAVAFGPNGRLHLVEVSPRLKLFHLAMGPWEQSTMSTKSEPDATTAGAAPKDEKKPMPPGELPPYRLEDQPWYAPLPPEMSIAREDVGRGNQELDVVLLTAVEFERDAVLRLLEPLPRRKTILRVPVGQETYFLGLFGAHSVALTMCAMGATSRDAAILATEAAIRGWRPKAVIMPGIAFGRDVKKQQMADVLIATYVIPYESQRVGAEIIPRAAQTESGAVLLNRFRNARWEFTRPDGTRCQRHFGPLLSGEKLVDDASFKDELFRRHPAAIGGEMEGAGVYAAAARLKVEAIVVKAICDWGDGQKHGRHQPLAAAVAVSFAHAVLADPNALTDLER
jgi:nucleoside phosphorylase